MSGPNSGQCSLTEWPLTVENSIRSCWSKIKIPRGLYSTTEMLCLGCSSAEAWSPVCAATPSSPGDAGQYLHLQIHRLILGISEDRKTTKQIKDARARNLRAVDDRDHVPLGSELSGHFQARRNQRKLQPLLTPLTSLHLTSSRPFLRQILVLHLLLISCILKPNYDLHKPQETHLRLAQQSQNNRPPDTFIRIISVRNPDEST